MFKPKSWWWLSILCVSHTVQAADFDVGGRIQTQVGRFEDSERDESMLTLESLRPSFKFSVNDFKAKASVELAQDVEVKSLYLDYRGFESLKIRLGNQDTPFSKERMTSSEEQLFFQRNLTGKKTIGSPGRSPGLSVQYENNHWVASVLFGLADLDYGKSAAEDKQGFTKLTLQSPLVRKENASLDLEAGQIRAASVEWYPLGQFEGQGAYLGPLKVLIGANGYHWQNRHADKPIDRVSAQSMHLGVRARGLSLDAQVNRIYGRGDTVVADRRLFIDGASNLIVTGFEAGYMLELIPIELAVSWSRVSDSNWDNSWYQRAAGFNFYLDQHSHKMQFGFMRDKNVKNRGLDELSLVLQHQIAF